ncbi:MAG: hypothetical protein DRN18_02125 [Thermoplasmata archaeon]|nr:MAG: hypothetical protein DRN18_02125 [Thermoplasmata archaeon]
MESDVIVVGAGPAGLAASIVSSSMGLKTILIEKSPEIGYPVKTSAFTFKEVIEQWNLPREVMIKWYTSFYMYSAHSKREVEVDFGRVIGGCLDYPRFLKELSVKAIERGTKIILSDAVVEPLLNGDVVEGVKTLHGKKIKSKIVIDSSGPAAVIGRKLGLVPKSTEIEMGIGIEYEMHNVKVRNPKAIDFYVGRKDVVPIGYGWIFPLSNNRARIGICTVYNTPEEIDEKNIEYWHSRFLSEDSVIYHRVKNAQPYAIHKGVYPLCGMLEKPYGNGLLLAGDSAAQASMLVGEGIRYALEFGKIAAEVAVEAFKEKDFSEDFLKIYVRKCKALLGEYFDVATDLLDVPTDEYWETVVDAIIRYKDLDSEKILKYLRTEMTYNDAKKLFPNFRNRYLRR